MNDKQESVGPYEVMQMLASGGMAEVFLARRRGPGGFDKRVVLKRIGRKLQSEMEVVSMFRDEACVQALLDHPNIVQIYDYGEDKGCPYIAMEFVSGATLRWLVDNARVVLRPIPLAHALRIACDVLAGLHHAHERCDDEGRPLGLVHRDISPVNILIGRNGLAKLCDFGVAKSQLQSVHTQVGVVKGKFRYMAPEQLNGLPVDRRADLFAVGVCLWEMLVGRRLFDHANEDGVVAAVRGGDYPAPSTWRPELPRHVDRLLMRAIHRDPDKRFATARDMQLACEDALRSLARPSNSALLGEYVSAELDGTLRWSQERPDGDLPQVASEAIPATVFSMLDPPLPSQPTTIASPREYYFDELTESLGPPSRLGRLLSAALLAPATAFAGLAGAANALSDLLRRPEKQAEVRVTRTTSPQ